ncbi:MAG: hypothetical protein NW201_02450, partial [Gemmatimonadales bacterium]|nr:hypothetical protein [Gemmatimonadales bacterium]
MRGGWTGGMGRSVVRALLAWGTLVLAPALAAQTEPRLREALRLQADGQSDSARVIVRGVLAATAPTDTLHPQAVFASALVAKDAPEQRRELQRLVVEFPTSAWTAEALVRLAMLDFAGGNLRGAARNVDRLATDFPGAPQLATAALWGARSYFELRNPVLACKWLADGMPKVGEDIELQNQLAFYQQRCTNVRLDAAAVDSARRTQDVVGLVEGDKPPAGAAEAGAPGPAPAVAPGAAPATPAA